MKEPVEVRYCGRVEYDDALRAMRLHAQALRQQTDHDSLLLVEHPPLFTLGRGAKEADILASPAELSRRGIEVHETDRGGEVTFHGPGQLVAYPVLDLSPDRRDVRKFVRALEQMMIDTCADYGVSAERLDGLPGVWLRGGERGDRKIGAVGIHLSHWISTHGVALNVTTDLSHYGLIVPCGIRDKGVTSLAAEGVTTTWRDAAHRLHRAFGEQFGLRLRVVEPEMRTVQVVVLREDGKVLILRRTMARGGFWQAVTGRIDRRESPLDAAQRELWEETGGRMPVRPLDYEHDFPLDPGITRRELVTVKWARETAFWTLAPASFDCRRAPREHDAHEWLTPSEAFERLPYQGLRTALKRALAAAEAEQGLSPRQLSLA
jgi:lipoyl(octanoyl) transferase